MKKKMMMTPDEMEPIGQAEEREPANVNPKIHTKVYTPRMIKMAGKAHCKSGKC